MIHPLSKKQPTIDDCQPRQLFQQSALRLSPKLLPCAKFTSKQHQTLHNCFEVPQVPPLVLASTCVQVGFHVSCSCARFGVPNHGQSPTELGLNYVSAGLPNPPPPNGLPTLDDHQVETHSPPRAHTRWTSRHPLELIRGGQPGSTMKNTSNENINAPPTISRT